MLARLECGRVRVFVIAAGADHGVASEAVVGDIQQAQMRYVRKAIESMFKGIGPGSQPVYVFDGGIINAVALGAQSDSLGRGEILEQRLRTGWVGGMARIHRNVHPGTQKAITVAARVVVKRERSIRT